MTAENEDHRLPLWREARSASLSRRYIEAAQPGPEDAAILARFAGKGESTPAGWTS
jgi:hypothetical protein